MSIRYQKRKKQARERAVSLVCYLCPVVWAALTPLTLLIPSLQYNNNQTGTGEPLSALGLMSNAWQYGRECLFGSDVEQTAGNLQFSKTVMLLLVALWLLYLVGAAAALWGLYAYLKFQGSDTDAHSGRLWFVTLIPNRGVLCLLCGLMLPLTLFHWLMVPLYRTLYVSVSLRILGFDPLWVSGLLLVTCAILWAVTAPKERAGRYDIFRKPQEPTPELPEEESEPEPEEETPAYESEARRRRAAEIARLLRENQENREHKD